MTTTPTTIYLNDDLKKELTKELDSLGITLNTYFNIAARQFVLQNHLPFEISDDIPTEKTEKTVILTKAKELELIKDDSVSFDDIDEAIKFLNSEV
ncbi:type II toxin-antitoxin system RelB/DinJ family antitoxin [Ligilactobacillus animalis]|uniref:type II toxin-antitoxin system RelB/DinJ family antitoxin n=1 Tax=Ligilactobacillus animalis TaxID=1605 RepID=UPI00384AB20F